MTIEKKDNQIVPLISTAQNFTTAWVDLGQAIDTMDCSTIGLWLDLAVHNSLNMRVRMVGLQTKAAASVYQNVIVNTTPSVVQVEPEYIELNVDADQKVVLSFPTIDLLPYVKFQIQVGTLGVTAAQVVSAGVSFKSNLTLGA